MMRRVTEPGQPLVVFGVLLVGWIVLRVAVWQSPFGDPAAPVPPARQADAVFATLRGGNAEPGPRAASAPSVAMAQPRSARHAYSPTDDGAGPIRPDAAPQPDPVSAPVDPTPVRAPVEPAPIEPLPPRSAAGHSLMLMAGFSNLALPPEIARYFPARQQPAPAAVPFPPASAMAGMSGADRWSADAWLLLRRDSTNAVTSGRGSYGQSQFGAVLRYRLWGSSGHRPTAYLRATQALAGARESEAALGLAARPVPGLPLVAAAEMRLARADGDTRARPAAYAVTELPPMRLPGGFTGEAYLQAGYVGGDFATGFIDGQVRAERKLFDLGAGELRAGGGVWGGAQEGASRLDVGPGATVRLAIGGTPARASMDWRFRIAGDAEPRSGAALTISAGF